MLRLDIEHAVNFSDRDTVNWKLNGSWQDLEKLPDLKRELSLFLGQQGRFLLGSIFASVTIDEISLEKVPSFRDY